MKETGEVFEDTLLIDQHRVKVLELIENRYSDLQIKVQEAVWRLSFSEKHVQLVERNVSEQSNLLLANKVAATGSHEQATDPSIEVASRCVYVKQQRRRVRQISIF